MRLRFWLGYALVAAIAIGSIATALVVHHREAASFERTQSGEAARSARQAEALAALSIGQLSSAAAFYRAEGAFTQHEFHVMAESLLETGGLSGTGFIQSVPRSRRLAFERGHGYPIVSRSTLGDLRREGRQSFYYPLVYAATETKIGVQIPLGYDLDSDPIRSPDLIAARDSGRPTATRVIRLPLGGTGINVFRPVYRDGAPTRTVAQRRDALVGFALGAFRLSNLTAAATAALPSDVNSQLVEDGRTVSGRPLDRSEAASAPFRVADRTWLLVVSDPSRPGVSLPLLIAVGGLSLAALLGALVLIWSRNERMQTLERQASHDPLTGLKNRRRFEEDLRTELARSRRERAPGALLVLDLDNFKQVNDTLGHPAGDRVIAEIAEVLRARMRATDVVARLGGDEFALVLPHCDLDEAEEVAEAIARAIRQRASAEEAAPPITASVGIATFGPGSDGYDAVLSAADNAMYEAKRQGRDAVRVAGQVVPAHGARGERDEV